MPGIVDMLLISVSKLVYLGLCVLCILYLFFNVFFNALSNVSFDAFLMHWRCNTQMTKNKSLARQVQEALQSRLKIRELKHLPKQEGRMFEGIILLRHL